MVPWGTKRKVTAARNQKAQAAMVAPDPCAILQLIPSVSKIVPSATKVNGELCSMISPEQKEAWNIKSVRPYNSMYSKTLITVIFHSDPDIGLHILTQVIRTTKNPMVNLVAPAL
jgi:hypothetical protein